MPFLTAVAVFLGTAIACVVYNRQLAEYFADNSLNILNWIFPTNPWLKHYLLWGYRIFLYVVATFCVAPIVIYLSFLLL